MAQYVGRVVGTKMPKTAKVAVTRLMLHPVIKKVIFLLCQSQNSFAKPEPAKAQASLSC